MIDPLTEFWAAEVRIEPARGAHISVPIGGPVWASAHPPEFARHVRDGAPVSTDPQASLAPARQLPGRYIWGGYAASNFGNFLAEYVPRLAAPSRRYPDARYVFLLPAGMSVASLKPWFWQVLAWFGITEQQVVFCGHEPLVVEQLGVFPQGEYMGRGGEPSPAYLDLLDEIGHTHISHFGGGGVVYVSRAGLGTRALGGERYLEEMLRRVGATPIRPEALSIREQLEWYARADTLIFAEGSAVHGRQLLGRRRGVEAVLVRRKGQRLARRALESRCDRLFYLDALDGSIHFTIDARSGKPEPFRAFALLNGYRLVESFRSVGVDLAPVWNQRRFERVLETDLEAWAVETCVGQSPETREARIRLMEGGLYACGMQKHAPKLAAIARATEQPVDQAHPSR